MRKWVYVPVISLKLSSFKFAALPFIMAMMEPTGTGPVFPVAHRDLGSVVGRFGDARDGGRRPHLGIDIAAPRGTAVLAVRDGIIDRVENTRLGGRVVWLKENGSRRRHYFAHLESVKVTRGQRVKAGQPIGTVGTTGNAAGTRPHLHYAVRLGNDILDPLSLFRATSTAVANAKSKAKGPVMRVKLNGAALKRTPNSNAATLAVISANQTVTIKGESGRFYRVNYRGKEGYLARWLLKS